MRYLKFTLICGALAALLAIGLFELGVFASLDTKLALFLGQAVPPPFSRMTQYWFAIFFGFGIAWSTADIIRPSLKAAVAVFAAAEIVTGVWVFNLYGVFYSPFASLTALVAAYVGASIYSQTAAGQRKRDLRHLLGYRVSEATFEALLHSDTPVPEEGEEYTATIVVCELFNHEKLTGALHPPAYVAITNSFLRNAGDFLVERGGYLESGSGEYVRVVFGAPRFEEQHASRACVAALALLAHLEAVNEECMSIWSQRFDCRIGISTGPVVLAAYGSPRLGSFSLTGEAADFARRLAAANIVYGSRILLSNDTFVLAEDAVEVRPIELIQRFPHETGREEIYELLALRGKLSEATSTQRDLFWKAIVFFREQKWAEALTHFRLAHQMNGGDAPAQFYVHRIEQALAGTHTLPELPRGHRPL